MTKFETVSGGWTIENVIRYTSEIYPTSYVQVTRDCGTESYTVAMMRDGMCVGTELVAERRNAETTRDAAVEYAYGWAKCAFGLRFDCAE